MIHKLGCGCRIDIRDSSLFRVLMCPLHENAQKLLAAILPFTKADWRGGKDPALPFEIARAREAYCAAAVESFENYGGKWVYNIYASTVQIKADSLEQALERAPAAFLKAQNQLQFEADLEGPDPCELDTADFIDKTCTVDHREKHEHSNLSTTDTDFATQP